MEGHEKSCKVMDEHLVSWSEEMSSEQFELWVEWAGGYVVWADGYVVVACRIIVSAPVQFRL